MQILQHFDMLSKEFSAPPLAKMSTKIVTSSWLRAKYSGLLHLKSNCGDFVEKNEVIATITDPYGSFRHKVKATNDGYIINSNEASLVYQGDAIFHLSTSEIKYD